MPTVCTTGMEEEDQLARVKKALGYWYSDVPFSLPDAFRVARTTHTLGTVRPHNAGDRATLRDIAQQLMALLLQGDAGMPGLVHSLGSDDLWRVAWAAANLRQHLHKGQVQQLDQLCVAVAARASRPGVMNGAESANMKQWSLLLWGLAKNGLHCSTCPELRQLMQHAVPAVSRQAKQGLGSAHFTHDLSNVAWACGTVGYSQDVELLVQVAACPGAMKAANEQDWANLLWAVASLYEQHPALYHTDLFNAGVTALCQMLSSGVAFKIKPQAVSNIMWACSAVGHSTGVAELLELLSAHPQLMEKANAHDWSQLVDAASWLGQGGIPSKSFEAALFPEALTRMAALPTLPPLAVARIE